MILVGENLGENLNSKVTRAVVDKANFEELKSQPENCDVDKLFKIDLASKYKNIEYILEVLKCGDIFYITRALKCLWLFNDDYSQFINTDYLQTNIFPCMSMKMKRKMITTISIHMSNADRAIDFYKYCNNAKLNKYANKFLVYTPNSFKLDVLKSCTKFTFDSKYLIQFIGNSFELALAYLALHKYSTDVIHKLRFLFNVSQEDYLNILENYIPTKYPNISQRLGIRISKDILNKHKRRVMDKPLLYVNLLNKSMLNKLLTIGDVESLSLALLPVDSDDFWSMDFYRTYKFILEKNPANNLYSYLKQIYISKYHDSTFEMNIKFYELKYYKMLTIDERETWALLHIERNLELPDIQNYIWYKFVSFPNAISGIKRYIFLTSIDYERSIILNILPETARNQDDINKILCYYYERHVNESEDVKNSFIDKVIELHDIYSFNKECWTSLDKLFHSLKGYTTEISSNVKYKFRSMIYHILHDNELPEVTPVSIDYCNSYSWIIDELSEDRKAVVSRYWLSYLAEKIKSLMDQHGSEDVKDEEDYFGNSGIKDQISDLIPDIWKVIKCFERPQEDCPEIVLKFMESNKSKFNYHKCVKRSEEDFVRWLKQDIQLVLSGISEIKCNAYRWNFRLCRLFRKLKVYFPKDLGTEYLNYFIKCLSEKSSHRHRYRITKMAVVGIFYLADPDVIISFLEECVPSNPKIDHLNNDDQVFEIQKAICRLSYHSRPPLPLSHIQKYITGDYVQYCLPTVYNYCATLPSNEEFINFLLDAPLSIRKHGLRLAFRSYDVEILKPIIKDAWKKTNNVSLRKLLYVRLFDRILNEKAEVQKDLYQVLKYYTLELNHDDHKKIYFKLISGELPDAFKGDFLETGWLTVSKLSDRRVDIQRRTSIIRHMKEYIHFVNRDFIRQQIIDDHVNDMLCKKNINNNIDNYYNYYSNQLIDAKWDLTAKYIVNFDNEIEQQRSLELMQTIMFECRDSWKLILENIYTVQKFMHEFIETIMDQDPKTIESCAYVVHIYQRIRDNLKSYWKYEEIFILNWELKLTIICRNIIIAARKQSDTKEDEPRNMSWKEIAYAYGNQLSIILKNSVVNDELYRCYYESMARKVLNIAYTFCDILDIGCNGFIYYLCDILIDFKTTKTQVLALCMLPKDPECDWKTEHVNIVTKLQSQFASPDVRSLFIKKYVMSDWKARHYVNVF